MIDFFQLTFSGLATGCIYALAALGFTLLWQASGTINFATGEFVMLPAFGMLGCMALGLPLWAAFVVTVLLAVLAGYGYRLGRIVVAYVTVVAAQDLAWDNDPFVGHANYRLAEEREGRWRIYKLADGVTRSER